MSLDQGQCFYKIRLVAEGSTDEELRVNNILVEPDGAATIAHVAASLYTKSLVRALAGSVTDPPKPRNDVSVFLPSAA